MFQQETIANVCYSCAGLAAGATTTLTSANAVHYTIAGKGYTKAAASNEATPTTDINTGAAFVALAAGKGSVFTVFRNTSGDLKVGQGTVVDLDALGNFVNNPWFCPVPSDHAPVGYILVKAKTGATTWTFGSSNLAGPPSNVVITYVNATGGMPAKII